ncbi:hypothetical protein BJY00DRAFT_140914 [Aspergillus carlsbadensis]|nr:hypothetical protein BJY00DRAFT_140914 [Aspergillus carlsbadensis]
MFGVGDRVIILTPGGGGYGVPEKDSNEAGAGASSAKGLEIRERDTRALLTNGSLGVRQAVATGN